MVVGAALTSLALLAPAALAVENRTPGSRVQRLSGCRRRLNTDPLSPVKTDPRRRQRERPGGLAERAGMLRELRAIVYRDPPELPTRQRYRPFPSQPSRAGARRRRPRGDRPRGGERLATRLPAPSSWRQRTSRSVDVRPIHLAVSRSMRLTTVDRMSSRRWSPTSIERGDRGSRRPQSPYGGTLSGFAFRAPEDVNRGRLD